MPAQHRRTPIAPIPHSAHLSRREALALLGTSAGGLWLGACRAVQSAPLAASCTVRPAQTEGPYFVEARLERSDIARDPADGSRVAGVPLEMEFRVSLAQAGACLPLVGAIVDVWHCDVRGYYSDVRERSFDTSGKRFLRGFQRSDAEGRVRFLSVYPGAYPGRAVHVHFKVRQPLAAERAREFTSQVYFDDALNQRVHANPLYASGARGGRVMRNDEDGIFQDGGSELLLSVSPDGAGYRARFELALRA